ncbi:MAG: DesA family fatty acid desaturase [Gammaproteobacteria bacterium]|jgi:stearoyl-CoA desaturase (delta-9 desaturase)
MFNDLFLWEYILITLVLTHVTIASVTIFLHRAQAHKSLSLSKFVSHFFRFWLWLTTGIVTKEWVAIHRKHHAKVDQPDDPHSPQQKGIAKVLLEGAELYRAESENEETLLQYGHDTPNDWLERKLYAGQSYLGIIIMLLLNVILMGAAGLTIWAIQMMWIPIFAAGIINGAGHWWGYRNFEPTDASTNIIPLAMFIGGEELHNNHHAFSSSAKFSSKWYEFDLGWFYICILNALGLVRVKKVAPVPVINHQNLAIDIETLRAVINSRFHVMSHYARDVIKKVYLEEKHKLESHKWNFTRRQMKLLIRHYALLDESAKQRLNKMLDESQSLKVVYEYNLRLQSIWQNKTASQEQLIQSLKEWCTHAEQTGISALADFAETIRGYRLQEV